MQQQHGCGSIGRKSRQNRDGWTRIEGKKEISELVISNSSNSVGLYQYIRGKKHVGNSNPMLVIIFYSVQMCLMISRSQYHEDMEIQVEVHDEVVEDHYNRKMESDRVVQAACEEVRLKIELYEPTNKIIV